MSKRAQNRHIFTGRSPAAVAVPWLAVLGAAGAGVMSLAHTGLAVPLVEDLGPGRPLMPVAVIFAAGAVAYAAVAFAAFRALSWWWPAGLGVNLLAVVAAAGQYRGPASLVAIVVGVASLLLLLTPAGRRAARG